MEKMSLPKEKEFVGPALIWKRILAFLIDMLILDFIIFTPFKNLLQGKIPVSSSFMETFKFLNSNTSYLSLVSTVSIVGSILIMLYFVLLEGKFGQSIGKKLLGIYVVSDTKLESKWQHVARSLFFLPVFPLILLWLADPLFLFFSKNGQRLSEIISKTRVVETYKY